MLNGAREKKRVREKRRKIKSKNERKENTPSRHFVENDDGAIDAASEDIVAAAVSIILSQNWNHTEHNLLAFPINGTKMKGKKITGAHTKNL